MPEEFPAVIVPVLENTGDNFAIFSGVCVEKQVFVTRENGCSLLAFDLDGSDFRIEATAGLRRRCVLLRHERKPILLFPRDLVLQRRESRRSRPSASWPKDRKIRRGTCRRRAPGCPRRYPSAHPRDNKGAATSIRCARQHAIQIAGGNLLEAERDGFDARRARLVLPCRRNFLRNAASDRNLARGIWVRLQPAGHCRRSFLDLLRLDAARSSAAFAATTAHVGGGERGERASKLPMGVRTAERM